MKGREEMKYGVLEYKNPRVINIGDGMQILSVLNLYKDLGIRTETIQRINYYELQTYNGEEVILPICFPFYGYNNDNRITCFSPKIKPLFFSLSLFDTDLKNDDVIYLKQFEPIGCRDEFTAIGLSQKGIKSYLNGCMTLTLNTTKRNVFAKKIYAIDIPEKLLDYIPAHIKQKLIFKTSIFKTISIEPDEYAKFLLDEFALEAKLVITSRLHAAIPCFAIGIPVVFVNAEYSYRFSWLEQILPVYLPEEWDEIDWTGNQISENNTALEIRRLMQENVCRRLKGLETYNIINQLQDIYNQRQKRAYIRGPLEIAKKYLSNHWNVSGMSIKYAIWGINQVASSLITYIESNYPNARCIAAIDISKQKEFKGITPKRIEDVNIKNLFVFVTADAVNPYALEYFQKIKKDPSTYLFLWKHIKLPIHELTEK